MPYVDKYNKDNIGQLYTVSSIKNNSNEILNGEYKGKTFYDFYKDNKEKYNIPFDEYPLLIALVDAKEDLSVQVHPNDKIAEELERVPFGKTESWYFLEEPDSGYIVNGCLCDTYNSFYEKVNNKDFENIIDHLKVEKGDYVFVEAGTLHALGSGSLVYEIQENSDLTYRFYDYNRIDENGNTRPLHIDKAKRAVDIKLKSKTERFTKEEILEKKYAVKKFIGHKYNNTLNTLEVITIVKGKSIVEDINVQMGTSIILEPNEEVVFSETVECCVAHYLL
ncbi:type I phosphomannose isomerase catalytic subunit [Clostridium sp. Marseille-Q2269]|uniref:type I phosphomannose isomerase catalytic subunit n=1 Tax=Clostridium sp. Marseille-Q2269 TaxID=2942205 RepID=UPI00207493B1|nr:type I phosphomannose isomerase catalytic subunit [Clostridium sp. Marseille-Q2269]